MKNKTEQFISDMSYAQFLIDMLVSSGCGILEAFRDAEAYMEDMKIQALEAQKVGEK